MKRAIRILLPILIVVGLIALFTYLVHGKQIDVLDPKGDVAAAQKDLIVFTVALSAVVVVPVFSMLGYFAYTYRAGNKKSNYMPDWSENRGLEALWWGIPLAIIAVLSIVIYQTSHSLDPYRQRPGDDPLKVQVVALRWKWLFIYPDQQVASLNQLPLPVDRPVTFDMSADAPMSAFWIPSLGSQIYAMNGMTSKLNLKPTEVGSYTGYTTNINGEGYAKMTFETKVMNGSTFDEWAKSAQDSPDAMTMKTYERLAEPESVTEVRRYRLANAKLYSLIAEKNGHNHGGASE